MCVLIPVSAFTTSHLIFYLPSPLLPPLFTLQLQRHYSQAWLLYGAGHLNSVLTLPDQALYQLNLLLVLF